MDRSSSSLHRVVLVACLILPCLPGVEPAIGAEPKPPKKHQKNPLSASFPLLAKMVHSYATAKTFYEASKIRLPDDVPRIAHNQTVRQQLWFERPNKLKIKSSEYEIVSDGKKIQIHAKQLSQYAVIDAPAAFDMQWITQHVSQTTLTLPITVYLLAICTELDGRLSDDKLSDQGTKALEEMVAAIKGRPEHDGRIRKKQCQAFVMNMPNEAVQIYAIQSLLAYIGEQDHLLWKLKVRRVSDTDTKWRTWTRIIKAKRNKKIDPKVFVIEPPAHATLVDQIQWTLP